MEALSLIPAVISNLGMFKIKSPHIVYIQHKKDLAEWFQLSLFYVEFNQNMVLKQKLHLHRSFDTH